MDPRLRSQGGGGGPSQDFDLRDPRDRGQSDRGFGGMRDMRDRDMRGDRDLRSDRDLRDPRGDKDLRAPLDPRAARRSGQEASSAAVAATVSKAAAAFSGMPGLGPGATDAEKAQLIMQVLQLTDEQIKILPEAQRQSILVLKEQIAKSTSQGR